MYPIHSDRLARLLPLALAAGVFLVTPVAAQNTEIVSQQISTSRSAASLRIELSDGRKADFAIRGGNAYLNGQNIGAAPRGAALDNSFRSLLSAVSAASEANVPNLLSKWSGNGTAAGVRLDRALEDIIRGVIPSSAGLNAAAAGDAAAADAAAADAAGAAAAADASANLDGVPASDSLDKLNERISELQNMVDEMDDEGSASVRIDRGNRWRPSPFDSLLRGIGDIFSVLVIYVIMFMIAAGVITFGGRKYIEGVADTARQMTLRSWLVGLAATFLVIPAFVLGIIALTISIVGIPALLVWIPLFPLGVVLSVILGYLAVAHAAGESFSERRYYVNDWFQRGNSYYFLITGLGLLLALFIGAGVVEMAGRWLGFIRGLMIFLGVVITWAAFTIGFGAVLVSRGGTRPLGKAPILDMEDYPEESHV